MRKKPRRINTNLTPNFSILNNLNPFFYYIIRVLRFDAHINYKRRETVYNNNVYVSIIGGFQAVTKKKKNI